MSTAAVILAAGTSRRFGSPKQEAPIGDRTMLDVVCGIARSAGLSPVLVVAPTSVALAADVVRVTNDRPEEGMSASLRLGIGAVPDGVDEAVIMLGDQPMLTPATIRALVGADREGRHAVASMAGDVIGPPVLLERSLFYLVDQATGDEGLRTVLAGRSELLTPFVLDEPPVDVDTPDDLKRRIEVCPGCGAIFEPLPEIKPHEYLGASGACWSAFGELIAREFSDPAYGVVHRHTVDIYRGAASRRGWAETAPVSCRPSHQPVCLARAWIGARCAPAGDAAPRRWPTGLAVARPAIRVFGHGPRRPVGDDRGRPRGADPKLGAGRLGRVGGASRHDPAVGGRGRHPVSDRIGHMFDSSANR